MHAPTPSASTSVIVVGDTVEYVVAGDWLGPHADAWTNVIRLLRARFGGIVLLDDRTVADVPDENLLATLNESLSDRRQIRVDVTPYFDDRT